MSSRRRLLGAAVVAACAFAVWQVAHCGSGNIDAESPSLAINRPWLERVPKTERDVVSHFFLLDHPRARVGIAGRSSRWKHDFEVFRWALENERLQLHFPQTNKKERRTVRVWRCGGDAPKPFDLCLELTSDSGRERFYSREDWKVEPNDAADDLRELSEDAPELAVVPLPPDAIPE